MRYLNFEKLLVPVDFSNESFTAVDAALELVKHPHQLCVVHVLPQITRLEVGIVWIAEYDEERCQRALDEMRDRLRDPKYCGIDLQVAIGDAAHQIIKAAEVTHANLIVIPSHSRPGCRHLLMGSVAERVLRLAQCPVLVLKHQNDVQYEQAESTVAGKSNLAPATRCSG